MKQSELYLNRSALTTTIREEKEIEEEKVEAGSPWPVSHGTSVQIKKKNTIS